MKKYGYETTDGHGYKLLLRNAKNNRRYATEAESVLWEYLRNEALGVRFRRQHPIGGYIPDFVCLKNRLIIEIDGGYHFFGDQPISDAERTNYLKERGFEVIRFKNEEVLCEINRVVQQIKDIIMAIQSTETPVGTPLLWREWGRLSLYPYLDWFRK